VTPGIGRAGFCGLFALLHLRPMRQACGRVLAVLLGVALGAAVFTSVRLAVHASLEAFRRSIDLVAGRADRVVHRPGGRVPESLVADLLRHPVVSAAAPFSSAYLRLPERSSPPFLLLGIDPLLEGPLRAWTPGASGARRGEAWRDLLARPGTFLPGAPLARRLGLAPGVPLRVEGPGGVGTLIPLEALDPSADPLPEGGALAICDIATFQEFTGTHGMVDRIDLLLAPGTDAAAVERLAASLPGGAALAPAGESRQGGLALIHAYQLNLTVLSFASLFVGMFLVYSLVALNATARRRELAVLRALGGGAGLALGGFLAEGAALGLGGWILSLPFSGLLARHLLGGVRQTVATLFVPIPAAGLQLPAGEILLSLGATLTVSLLAALAPARAAMRVPPREALGSTPQVALSGERPRRLALQGAAALLLVPPLALLPGIRGGPLGGYLAVLALLVGFSLAAPWGLQRTGALLGRALAAAGGTPAWLAARYLRDSGTRTAVTVGALITAVALFCALVIMIHSFRETVKLWTEQTISGDLFVAPRLADLNRFRDPLSPQAVAAIRTLQSPAEAVPNRRFFLSAGSVAYQLEGLALDPFLRHGDFFYAAGDPVRIVPALRAGQGVVVSEVFANRTGLEISDRFQARVEGAAIDLPILGIIRDYRTQGGVVFCDLGLLERLLPGLRWGAVRFYLRAGPEGDREAALAGLRGELAACCGGELEMIAGRQLRASVLRIFDETFAVTGLLLAIALAVAVLGIATTLVILVLERRQELLTLVALGAAAGQVRAMIAWKALLMVLAGEAGGLLCGAILSWLLVFVINRQSFGWTFLYRVDWGALALSLPLIAAAALAAALPAWRLIQRQAPADALRAR
jgi:putative ABC transport system permease protein